MMTTSARRRESTYTAVARDMRKQILQGRYAGGRRLPTEVEFAARYRVSRQTVRRAFHDLVSEGIVYRTPGRGTFAAPRDGSYARQFGSVDDLGCPRTPGWRSSLRCAARWTSAPLAG